MIAEGTAVEPTWQSHDGRVRLYLGDCDELLVAVAPQDAATTIVVADPPYGCKKADWDETFPTAWWNAADAVARMVVTITGSSGLKQSVRMCGDAFVDVIAARNLNGMTRGPIGYGNWLAAVISGEKPRMGPNAFDFCVTGDMPDHPSPKPVEYMLRLVERVTEESETVIDPFMGSGTTGLACVKLGRPFIGIEKDPKHFDTARTRIQEALGMEVKSKDGTTQKRLFGQDVNGVMP